MNWHAVKECSKHPFAGFYITKANRKKCIQCADEYYKAYRAEWEKHRAPRDRKAYSRMWYHAHVEFAKNRWLVRAYDMTLEEWRELFILQGKACAICGITISKRWHTDHGGRGVRGILCTNCNTSLGKFKDDPVLLRKAALYVENDGSDCAAKFRKPHFNALETRHGVKKRAI